VVKRGRSQFGIKVMGEAGDQCDGSDEGSGYLPFNESASQQKRAADEQG